MLKAELRKKYKALRNTLLNQEIDNLSIAIANKLLKLPIWQYSFYHVYLSIKEQKEVNTDYILNILSGKDKHIVISKTDFTTVKMTHFLLTDNTLIRKNKYNIPEPTNGIEISNDDLEVVFIPLLAFDKKGHRVGYGKGFYDSFLSKCKPNTIKIGLSFYEADLDITDVFENDIKLDFCVTPEMVYRF